MSPEGALDGVGVERACDRLDGAEGHGVLRCGEAPPDPRGRSSGAERGERLECSRRSKVGDETPGRQLRDPDCGAGVGGNDRDALAARAGGRPGGSGVQHGDDALSWWNVRHPCRLLDVGRRRLQDGIGRWRLRRRRGCPALLRLDCRLEPPGQALDLGGMLGSGRLERRLETGLLRRELRGQAFNLGGRRLERRFEAGSFRREALGQMLDLGGTLGSGRLERRLETSLLRCDLRGEALDLGSGRLELRLETGLLRPEALGHTLDLSGPLGSSGLERRLEAGPFRRETLGQALDLGGMLGGGGLGCAKAGVLRGETLGQAPDLGGLLDRPRLERRLDPCVLRSLGCSGFHRGGEPGPFALRRSQRCDQELDPIGVSPLGFSGSG